MMYTLVCMIRRPKVIHATRCGDSRPKHVVNHDARRNPIHVLVQPVPLSIFKPHSHPFSPLISASLECCGAFIAFLFFHFQASLHRHFDSTNFKRPDSIASPIRMQFHFQFWPCSPLSSTLSGATKKQICTIPPTAIATDQDQNSAP